MRTLPTSRFFSLLFAIITTLAARAAPVIVDLHATAQQQQWLHEANINLKNFIGKPADEHLVNGVLKRFVGYYENNGYPFARAQFDSISIDSAKFSATLILSKGNYIIIDSLVAKCEGKVRASFLRNHLGLRHPKPYSETFVNSVEQRINSLGFAGCTQTPTVEFRQHVAHIYAYVESHKANRANALVAFGTDNAGKFEMSGEASLFLANMFGGGEQLGVEWCSPQIKSQLLHANIALPYLVLNTIGVEAQIDMDRRDTLYMSIGGRLGLSARINAAGMLSIFAQVQRNAGIAQEQNARSTLGGMNIRISNVNNPFFSQRGYEVNATIGVGKRSIGGQSTIMGLLDVDASRYFFLHNRWCIATRIRGGAKFLPHSAKQLMQGEQYCIGGANSLRGFAERSIFASAYALATLEPRFYFGEQGYLHVFYDFALCDRNTFHGFGVGTRFATGAGIFSISVAMGNKVGGRIAPTSTKVHVGYVAVF